MKIRSDILRVYQSLHTWVGITAGMLLFIGFFGGALTMFKIPLERWASAPVALVQAESAGALAAAAGLDPAAGTRVMPSDAQLDAIVRQMLERYPATREDFTLHLELRENTPAPLSWDTPGRGLNLDARRWQGSADGNGQLQVAEQRPSQLGELIDLLHRTGGIPGTIAGEYIGGYLMGVAGVLYFLALVSGLILLLPTLVKDLFVLRAGKNRKRFWLDTHNIVGIASLPYHIVISVTVIVFAFHDQFYDGLEKVVYGAQPMFGARPKPGAQPHKIEQMQPVSRLIATVKAEAPEFVLAEMLFMGLESPRPMVRAAVRSPRYLMQGPVAAYVMLDPYTGRITSTSMLPSKDNGWSELVAPFFALHFGSYGGDTMRWVYFAFGISGAFLFYSGNLLWVEKRRKNQLRNQAPVRQTLTTLRMAAATVGICLGSVAAALFAIVASKFWYPFADNINSSVTQVYYTVFVLALGWAWWRGAAHASVHLLRVCALGAAAIPFSTLLAVWMPAMGWWAYGRSGTLAIDVAGGVAAALFWMGARLTARRVAQGPEDSVWSVSAAAPDSSAAEGAVRTGV